MYAAQTFNFQFLILQHGMIPFFLNLLNLYLYLHSSININNIVDNVIVIITYLHNFIMKKSILKCVFSIE